MKRKLLTITILWFPMFLITSCDHDHAIKIATFYVHNNSQFDVTELGLSHGSEESFKELLKSSEICTLRTDWVDGGGPDGKSLGQRIHFIVNGEEWGCIAESELATADPDKFKRGRWVTDGETVTVHIYDDHWEWWTVE